MSSDFRDELEAAGRLAHERLAALEDPAVVEALADVDEPDPDYVEVEHDDDVPRLTDDEWQYVLDMNAGGSDG